MANPNIWLYIVIFWFLVFSEFIKNGYITEQLLIYRAGSLLKVKIWFNASQNPSFSDSLMTL